MAIAPNGSKGAAEKPARRLKIPLSLKFAAVTVALVALLLAAGAALSLWSGYVATERSALALQQERAQALAGSIGGSISELQGQLAWTAERDWQASGVEQQRADFARILRQFPAIVELFHIDSRGLEQLKVSRLAPDSLASLASHANEPRFVETVKARNWFGPVYVRNGADLAGTIGVAHADGGVTVAELDLAFLAAPVKAAAGNGQEAFVVDGAGRLIAHPSRNPVTGENDLSALPQVAEALAAGGAGTSMDAVGEDGSVPAFAAWAQVPGPGWTAIVQTPKADALSPFRELLWQTGLLLAAGLLAAAIVGVWLARRVAVPIKRLQASTELLGEGDLTQRVALRRRDEIGALADTFNAMANRLQQSRKGLEEKIDDSAVGFDIALQQQSLTAEMLKTISRTDYDLERVLDTLIGSAVRLSEANVGAVWLRDGDAYRLAAQLGHTSDWAEAARQAPFTRDTDLHAVAAAAAYSGQVINVDDVSRDLRFMGDYGERPANADERAALAVPLKHGDRVEAVFSLSRADPLPFLERQVSVVQDFADQALIAIRNVRLLKTIEDGNRDIAESLEQRTATGRILHAIAQSPTDSHPVLDAIADSAARLCNARFCHIALLDGTRLQVRAHRGLPPEARDLVTAGAAPSAGSAAGQAMERRKAVLVADLQAEPAEAFDDLSRLLGIRSVAIVPLLKDGAAIGVMTVADPEPNALPEHRLALLETLADHAVIALDEARLHEEARLRTTERDATLQQLAERTAERDEWRQRHAGDLEAAERRHAAELDEIRRLHVAEVEAARQRFDAAGLQHAAEMEEARRLHAAEVEDARQRFDAAKQQHAAEMDEVRRLHAAEVEEARREFDAAGQQHAAEMDEARRLHASEVEAARQRFEDAEQRHAAALDEAGRLHAAEAEEARQRFDEAEQQHAAEAEEARQLHAAEVEEARLRFDAAEQQHAAEMDEARRHHADELDQARQRFDAAEQQHAAEMDEARRHHAQDVEEARQKYEAAEQRHAAAVEEAGRLHAAELDQARQRFDAAEQQHAAEMGEARRLHAEALDDAHKVRAAELDQARHLHAAELEDARRLHAEDRDGANSFVRATTHALKLLGDAEGDPKPVFDAVVATAAQLCRADAVELRIEEAGRARLVAAKGTTAGTGGATLAVPLMLDGEEAGGLTLSRVAAEAFSEHEIELAGTLAAQAAVAIGTARLAGALDARNQSLGKALREREATARMLAILGRARIDLGAVLDTLARSAAELCNAGMAAICLGDGAKLENAGSVGFPDGWLGDAGYLQTAGLARRAAREAEPLQLAGDASSGNAIAVPLPGPGGAIGALVIARQAPFGDAEFAVAATLADQAVIAIENVRLIEALETRTSEVRARTVEVGEAQRRQAAIAAVLKAISGPGFELGGVLTTLTASAASLCNAGGAAIYLMKDGAYRVGAATGAMPEPLVRTQPPGRDSWVGRAALDRAVVHAADADSDAEHAGIARIEGLGAILCVPLLHDGTAIGVFALTRSTPGPFSGPEIELAQTFADEAAIAIEEARRSGEAQARARELAALLQDLHAAQARLAESERLASLGRLTTGIGQDIEERLKAVNDESLRSNKLVDDIRMVLEGAVIDGGTRAEVEELGDTLKANLDKVVWEGRRAESAVRNTLLQSLEGPGEHRRVDINAVVDESLGIAYHGARAERRDFDIKLEKVLDPKAGAVDLYPQEITRVLINLFSNGIDAMARRGAAANGGGYEPMLTASTKNLGDAVEIRIRDNGTGIAADVRESMYDPFFTTKPAGQGTGLGLSLSRDIIVKQHGGTIEMDTVPGSFTEFRIVLPRRAAAPMTRPEGGDTDQSS
ncbi:GAF domain-containing protein [Mesorhizobium sp. KR9-304]|uniref:GAF domain-containing protein n=1 Tax=Mesorhizobium sp. KR9-304 TaxID=3156614 RepID=UPI0032B53EFF